MSWMRFNVRGGVLKVKPRWQMRSAERDRRVPVIDLGLIIISWWNTRALQQFEPAAYPATPRKKPSADES